MTIVTALVVAVVFGVGVQLMLARDLLRLAAGVLVSTNAAVLLLVSAGLGGQTRRGSAAEETAAADPLVQALAITAIVIGFGTAVLLLRVAVAIERTHETLDMEDLVAAEVSEDEEEPGHSGDEHPEEERQP